ncbi:MAG: hypothetical protein WEC36_15795 [Phycisphaeraceae bacterium]
MATILERLRSKRTTEVQKLWAKYRAALERGEQADAGEVEKLMATLGIDPATAQGHAEAIAKRRELDARLQRGEAANAERIALAATLAELQARRHQFLAEVDPKITHLSLAVERLAYEAGWAGAPVQNEIHELEAAHPDLFGAPR